MRDFTLKCYQQLLSTFLENGFQFVTFESYCQKRNPEKMVILRHDVDLKALNALKTAQIESDFGIAGSYYFRTLPESNQPTIIREMVALGHEIGYHYEDVTLCKGDLQAAYTHFCTQLNYFRTFYPVKTICMHGSPASKYDNRMLWEKYNYRTLDIIGEPYFDVDFNQVLYLTDTGRRWDGALFSVRDKVQSDIKLSFHRTTDIIQSIQNNTIPHKIMITVHPQRWTNHYGEWLLEWLFQNLKNGIKRWIVK